MRNAYLHTANVDVSVNRSRNFCKNKDKMIISREDGMLIKVLHQEKGYGSKKLLAEFPNKVFERTRCSSYYGCFGALVKKCQM